MASQAIPFFPSLPLPPVQSSPAGIALMASSLFHPTPLFAHLSHRLVLSRLSCPFSAILCGSPFSFFPFLPNCHLSRLTFAGITFILFFLPCLVRLFCRLTLFTGLRAVFALLFESLFRLVDILSLPTHPPTSSRSLLWSPASPLTRRRAS